MPTDSRPATKTATTVPDPPVRPRDPHLPGQFPEFLLPPRDDQGRLPAHLPIGLMSFRSEYAAQTELLMAATVMYVLPLVVFFVFMQKQIVAGIQLGGVKG